MALIAVLSALAVVAGVGMIYLPAGVITCGLFGLAGVYIARYLKVHGGTT